MKEEEYNYIRQRIRKRAELERLYYISQIESGNDFIYTVDDFLSEIFDCIAFNKELDLNKYKLL